MRRFLWLAVLSSVWGCASGYEPGPLRMDQAEVPTPLGVYRFTGERDTSLSISGMKGDGVHFPSIDQLVLTRSASGPLGTRGAAQSAVIDAQALAFERSVGTLVQAAERLTTLAAGWQSQQAAIAAAQPQRTSPLEQLLTLVLARELGVTPGGQEAPSSQPTR